MTRLEVEVAPNVLALTFPCHISSERTANPKQFPPDIAMLVSLNHVCASGIRSQRRRLASAQTESPNIFWTSAGVRLRGVSPSDNEAP